MLFNFENENEKRMLQESLAFHNIDAMQEETSISDLNAILAESDELLDAASELTEVLEESMDVLLGTSEFESVLNESAELLEGMGYNFDEEDVEALYESFDGDEDLLNESMDVMSAQEVFLEANIIKMDVKTLKKRLLRRCALFVAKENNDPLYAKYVKFAKAKKEMRAQIQKKYEGPAKAKLKELINRRKNKNAGQKGVQQPKLIKPQARS